MRPVGVVGGGRSGGAAAGGHPGGGHILLGPLWRNQNCRTFDLVIAINFIVVTFRLWPLHKRIT